MLLPFGWNRRGDKAPLAYWRALAPRRKSRLRPAVESLEKKALLTYVSPTLGFLAGPQAGKPLDIAMNYLANHQADYQMSGDDLSRLFVTDNYTDSSMGVTHVYLRQGFNGVPILNSDVNVNIGPNGEVISIGGEFIPNLGTLPSAQSPPLPAITAQQAIAAAATQLNLPGNSDSTIASVNNGDPTQQMILQAPGISRSDIRAKLRYVKADDNTLQLAWEVPIDSTASSDYWDPYVDANTGKLVFLINWTDHYDASYNVLSLNNRTRSPDDGSRATVINPSDPLASPAGWQATSLGGSPTFTITRGNNAFAYEDHAAADAPGFSPDGGSKLNFDFPLSLSLDPTAYVGAAVTNEFYWVNIAHDIWYHYGFDEKSGNFQENNFSNGGVGSDAVLAEAQDGGGTDNANFATPPDGSPGRMQMYLFDLTNPQRDGDLDPEIIVHEFGHGLSNRLTGGPSNAGALDDIQSGAMGEGWSDFWSLAFLVHPGDDKNTPRPTGTYVLGQPTSGGGVRRFPYSFDMTINPETIGDYNSDNEAHDAGEIWCQTLWDMHWLLVDKYGYDSNLYTGTGGNDLAIKLILEGMMLQPANPTFRDARDAILRADQLLNGGLDQFEIWTAFARRGMGLSFNPGADANSTSVTPATDLPKFLMVKAQTVANATELTALNNVVIATISDPAGTGSASAYKATVDWGDGTIDTASVVQKSPSDKTSFNVLGTHTYQVGGVYSVKVSVVRVDGSDAAFAKSQLNVMGLPMSASGTSLTLKEGDEFQGVLAHFVDSAPVTRPANFYTATISFGDGVNAVGTIVDSPGGGFDVIDTSGHVFGGGTYNVTIAISKPGATATALSPAIVTDSPLSASGLAFQPIEGTFFPSPIAIFNDEDPRVPPISNYFATIDWGDGSAPTSGRIIPNPLGGGYAVVGDHGYNVGSYAVIVTVGNFSGGSTAVGLASADVEDAPLQAGGLNLTQTAGVTTRSILATFSDTDPRANPTSHYSATVDWGDGTTEAGQVVVNEDGGYLVYGTHAYRSGSFPVKTTISDFGGSTAVATGTATIPDSPVTVTVNKSIHLPAGTAPTVPVYIGTFKTLNALALPTDFTATVNYGDGTSVNEPIESNGVAGSFRIRSTKVYDQEGSYSIAVVITSPGGDQVQTPGTVVVDAAPITAAATLITGTSKTTLTAIPVASFVSANPHAVASAYSASINWGDGQATAGTVASNGLGGFLVTGDHRFAEGGTFKVVVTITGSNNATVATLLDTAMIADLLTPLSGGATNTPGGQISSTGLTNSSQPIFAGFAEPFAHVKIFTVPPGGAAQTLVASGQADASGHYSLTSTPIADGQYTVMASATDAAGKPSSGTTVLYPTPSRGLLTVDTQGPTVSSSQLNPRTGKLTIQLRDGLSGLGSGVLDAGNFTLTAPNGRSYPVTGLTVSPVSPNTNQTVTLTFGTASPLRKGAYVLRISASGVTDRAGNVLDERYFVPFPGLYNRAGQNYTARFNTDGRVVTAPTQFIPPTEVVAAQKHRLFVRKHLRR